MGQDKVKISMKKLAICHGHICQDHVSIQHGNLHYDNQSVELDNTYDNYLAIYGCQLDLKMPHDKSHKPP